VKIVVTGSSGQLGSILSSALVQEGQQVIGLGRRTQIAFDLARAYDTRSAWRASLAGAEILVHAAWDLETLPLERRAEINVTGSRILFSEARAAGVKRIVFLSSTLARSDSKSQYGISKMKVEQLLALEVDLVLRIGWVLGTAAVSDILRNVLRFFPRVPWLGTGNERIYWIERETFVDAVPALIVSDQTGLCYVMRNRPLLPEAFLSKILDRETVSIIPLRTDRFGAVARLLGVSHQRIDSLQDLRAIDIEYGTTMIP
jgi:nucleoside-diphosphate-sugar epimerase